MSNQILTKTIRDDFNYGFQALATDKKTLILALKTAICNLEHTFPDKDSGVCSGNFSYNVEIKTNEQTNNV